MKGKKGRIDQIQGIVIALAVIGILLGVGILVLEELIGQDALSDTDYAVANETVTLAERTGNSKLDKSGECQADTFAVDVVYNSTWTKIASGNYSIDSDSGRFKNTTGEFGVGDWKVSYTYEAGDTSCTAINETISATNEIPTWLAIIVILAVVGILLAIVFAVLPSGEGDGNVITKALGGGGGGGTVAEI